MHLAKKSAAFRIAARRHRRGYAAVFILILSVILLAACGNGANQAAAGSTGAGAVQDQGSSGIPSDSGAAANEPQANSTKHIQHVYGETDIPSEPQRIVSIGLEDMLLSLEVPLVQADAMEGHYLYGKLQENNIPVIYMVPPLNFEAVLAAQPDLIIVANGYADEAAYERLAQIAPTIAYVRDEWKTAIVEIGKALDREDKANAVIQAYDDKLKQAKETIVQAVGADKTVALVRPSEKDVQLFFPGFAYGGVLYNDLGLAPAANIAEYRQTTKDDWGISLSLEKLPELTADYLFVTAGGSISLESDFQKSLDVVTGVEKLQVWQAVPAVKQDHVYKLSARHWMLSGPIADSMKIDDVVAAVTGSK